MRKMLLAGLLEVLLLAGTAAGETIVASGMSLNTSRGMGYEGSFKPGLFLYLKQPVGRRLEVRNTVEYSREKKFFLPDGMLWGNNASLDYKVAEHFSLVGIADFRQQRNSQYVKSNVNFGGGIRLDTGRLGKTEAETHVVFLAPDVVAFNKTRGIDWGLKLTHCAGKRWGLYLALDSGRYWFVQPGESRLLSGTGLSFKIGSAFRLGGRGV